MSSNQNFQTSGPNSPLTEQHLSDINLALRALDQAEYMANQAQAAGIDSSQHLTTIQAQRNQLQQIKNVYFPGR